MDILAKRLSMGTYHWPCINAPPPHQKSSALNKVLFTLSSFLSFLIFIFFKFLSLVTNKLGYTWHHRHQHNKARETLGLVVLRMPEISVQTQHPILQLVDKGKGVTSANCNAATFRTWEPPVVYNCFFAETCPATKHWHDIILYAVWKRKHWLLREANRSEGESVVGWKRGVGGKKIFWAHYTHTTLNTHL